MRVHPLFLIQQFLNERITQINVPTIRNILKHSLPKFYQQVSVLDNKFILCENSVKIPDVEITKDVCIFYIRKTVEYQDVLQFKDKTEQSIKDKNYTRILILTDVSESMKDFIVSQNIDYIHYNFQTKKWETSYQRLKKYRDKFTDDEDKFKVVREKVFGV